jgi:hypothetical protein
LLLLLLLQVVMVVTPKVDKIHRERRAKLELFTLVSRNKYIIIIIVHSQVRDGGPKDPGSSRADCKRLAIDG